MRLGRHTCFALAIMLAGLFSSAELPSPAEASSSCAVKAIALSLTPFSRPAPGQERFFVADVTLQASTEGMYRGTFVIQTASGDNIISFARRFSKTMVVKGAVAGLEFAYDPDRYGIVSNVYVSSSARGGGKPLPCAPTFMSEYSAPSGLMLATSEYSAPFEAMKRRVLAERQAEEERYPQLVEPLHAAPFKYAARSGVTYGFVLYVRIDIDPSGHPHNGTIVRQDNYDAAQQTEYDVADRAAITAAMTSTYRPKVVNGRPVWSRAVVVYDGDQPKIEAARRSEIANSGHTDPGGSSSARPVPASSNDGDGGLAGLIAETTVASPGPSPSPSQNSCQDADAVIQAPSRVDLRTLARQYGHHQVQLLLTVPDGPDPVVTASTISITTSSGSSTVDEAAERYASNIRFFPATRNCKSAVSTYPLSVSF